MRPRSWRVPERAWSERRLPPDGGFPWRISGTAGCGRWGRLDLLPKADRQQLCALVSAEHNAFEICDIARNANCESHMCLYHLDQCCLIRKRHCTSKRILAERRRIPCSGVEMEPRQVALLGLLISITR